MDTKDSLIENSKSAAFAAIEIHNKPVFPYRYEVTTILLINAWELLLKAFIVSYTDIKIIDDNGITKPFDDCNDIVRSKIGKDYLVAYENLNSVYEYRCKVIHFYEEGIGILLFSLLSKSVVLYYEFLKKYFDINIEEEANLYLMPIGFKPPVSPIDFLSNQSEISKISTTVQIFIKSITDSIHALHKDGVEDSILLTYRVALVNENRLRNADIIAGITKDKSEAKISIDNIIGEMKISNEETAKKVKVEEDSIYDKIYTETFNDVLIVARNRFLNFSQNAEFYKLMRGLKGNPTFHKVRFLDVKKEKGSKDYYTKSVYDELAKYYKPK